MQREGIGVCTNGQCERAKGRQPIERYPGPGQYCPACGELLSSEDEGPTAQPGPAATPEREAPVEREWPFGSAAAPQHIPAAVGNPADRRRHLIIGASTAIALLAVAAVGVGVTRFIPAFGVRVCTSTMTDGIAKEIVSAYFSQHPVWPYHYTITRPGDLACDVRFFAALDGDKEPIIARDGVVAIVNPQNSVARLEESQMRDVFAGRVVDWSQVGGRPGAIAAAVPGDDSDEAQALEHRLMSGQPLASRVGRTLTAAQIVRWVASPSGMRSIGIVPFSAALPAKVVALAGPPAPSSLSIADERYPLSVRLLASSDFREPSGPAAGLVAFAHSTAANSLLRRALVTPSGS